MLPVLDIRTLVGVPVTPLASSARLVVVIAGLRGELTAGVVARRRFVRDGRPAAVRGRAAIALAASTTTGRGSSSPDFVGNLDVSTGLFTPALDGPNPKRRFGRNNYGDVWAVATYKPAGADQPVTGRSYLVVAIPQYLRFDQPEVAQ